MTKLFSILNENLPQAFFGRRFTGIYRCWRPLVRFMKASREFLSPWVGAKPKDLPVPRWVQGELAFSEASVSHVARPPLRRLPLASRGVELKKGVSL